MLNILLFKKQPLWNEIRTRLLDPGNRIFFFSNILVKDIDMAGFSDKSIGRVSNHSCPLIIPRILKQIIFCFLPEHK